MHCTKDKLRDIVDSSIELSSNPLDEAHKEIDVIERIGKVHDDLSKNAKLSTMDEYNAIYIEDKVYSNLIKERDRCTDIRSDILAKLGLDMDLSQEDISNKLNYIKTELGPHIEKLDSELDDRREKINSHREDYEIKSDNKKTKSKVATMSFISIGVAGTGYLFYKEPKVRKLATTGIVAAIKGGNLLK